MDAITICAANYLPFASVLGDSFLKTNPESTFTILVVDAARTDFSKNPLFRYLTPDDLDIPPNVFQNMAFYYNVTELSTALKPSALKKLFSSGSKKVIYLDPDIQVFSALRELDEALEANSIVLTPHTLNPIPRDGLKPSEADIMGSGTFNLGFIGLSKSDIADQMLDWWEERLRFDSISDPEEMLFTDQRWIDFVPSYFPFFVLRKPSYNVAYWNLHERKLSEQNNVVLVNEKELRFFHFSGYRPEKPWILSKYVSDNPRIVISKDKILRNLCANYSEYALRNGWTTENSVTYGYQNFETGKAIPHSLRRLYREDCIQAEKSGTTLVPPKNWQEWSTTRTPDTGNLSRILFSLWKSRPDLKRRYPDATGNEAKDLQAWARTHGISEGVIDSDLIEIGNLQSDQFPSKFSNKKGLNVAGYLQGEFGLGQSARLILQSAKASGLPAFPLNSNRSKVRQEEKLSENNSESIFPVIVSVVNADHFELWLNDIGSNRLKYSKVIGVWAWETEDFPVSMHKAFKYVDEIWAVSNFVKDAIAPYTKKKVLVLPTPIITPERIEKLDRATLGIPEDQEFNLFIFDYQSVFNRKNPLGLVEAHRKAFPNSEGPLLVIKSTNGDQDAENREKLRFAVQDRTDILLIQDFVSREQLTSLINECSTYISLHRSEGYGLTMAEAMALGKPVIATSYSGNLDFMNRENSVLIPFKRTLVGKESFPYQHSSYWAEPDTDQAALEIKKLHENPMLRAQLGSAAQISVTNTFSTTRASKFIASRVKENYSYFSVAKMQFIDSIKNLLPNSIKRHTARLSKRLIRFLVRRLES